ncbi:MAG TPA: hypothetical protein ENK57_07355 [Polyangiaceae bacterium]|nr:hypothetical protein [Polyangiaceae bacterium]
MPTPKATSRYQITDPNDPTRWRDLSVSDADAADFRTRNVGERAKVYRVLIPKGRHEFGATFPLFERARSKMDASWDKGVLPHKEVGIVHRIGVGVSPVVCDQRTDRGDITRVLSNAYIQVAVNDETILEGSLETLPIGLGVHGADLLNNGLPAADAVPDRVPFIYTNREAKFSGAISLPQRSWLQDAMTHMNAPGEPSADGADGSGGADTEPCGRAEPPPASTHCMTLETDVLVTLYMIGVFAEVVETPND